MSFLFLFFLLVLVTTVFGGCICPSGECRNMIYFGDNDACFCWCQTNARYRSVSPAATCSYIPRTSGSHGFCSLCDPSISSSDFIPELTNSIQNSIQIDSNNDLIFPIRKCKCQGGNCDWGFSGNYDQCVAWAKTQAGSFLGNQFSVSYIPRGGRFQGMCSVCGLTDPCKRF
ncbi:hypothetical protein RCL1_009157 [Eukaryota sp. TZLM3-RCL]